MQRSSAIVDTPSGKLRGSSERSCLGDNYYAFKGVPYAEPPIGRLRFRDPQPLKPWTDTREATSYGPISAQYDNSSKQVIGSEDCLYLNVYTRNLNASSSRSPVMFFIPGGGYYDDANDDYYGPDYFMSKDVVLVTVNFRLGVFGFLDLRDEVASGNQGLKDQVMALKWVKSHIINFGGDPDNVTIFGESAGSACVHLLAVSQMAKGLFHKAICQSGTALGPSLRHRVPDEKEMIEFLQSLNIHEKDPTAIVECLRKIGFEKLIEVQTQLANSHKFLKGKRLFLPTVDDKSEEPFMPVSAVEATKQGVQVPFMIGYNQSEGLFYLNVCNRDLSEIDQHLEDYTFVDEVLRANNLTFPELRYLYFKNDAITEKNVASLVRYLSDMVVTERVHRVVKIQTQCGSAPTYLYKFTYDKNLTILKMNLKYTVEGPNHGDELMYLFRAKLCDAANLEQLQQGTGADRVMRQMVELWTNFAKYGRPTLETSDLLPVHWLPVTDDVVLRYLNIGEELRMEKELNLEQRYSYKNTAP